MPFQIIRADITTLKVDAIVNAANSSLLGGGGVDGAIHRAAGPELLEECRTLGGCKTGDAKLTRGYRLPCRYVIHTVGPVWYGGGRGEEKLLRSAYDRSFALAAEHGCETVAFPLISAGAYGYPKAEALEIAVDCIRSFLDGHDMTVILTVFDKEAFLAGLHIDAGLASYIDDTYAAEHTERNRRPECSVLPETDACPPAQMLNSMAAVKGKRKPAKKDDGLFSKFAGSKAEKFSAHAVMGSTAADTRADDTADIPAEVPAELAGALQTLDESFAEMLFRKIDERGMTDAACYKKANIDRKLFSKIRSNAQYKPSKPTVLAFAVALELSYDETAELLSRAGFAFSHANKFDIIVEYFIRKGNYDIFVINEALFAYDQSLLGA